MRTKLPNCQDAYIPIEKITQYLMNLNHSHGKGKAMFFHHVGYSEGHYDQLRHDLILFACKGDIEAQTPHQDGTKYVVTGDFTAPNHRTYSLKTIWVIDETENISRPRLITAYPN